MPLYSGLIKPPAPHNCKAAGANSLLKAAIYIFTMWLSWSERYKMEQSVALFFAFIFIFTFLGLSVQEKYRSIYTQIEILIIRFWAFHVTGSKNHCASKIVFTFISHNFPKKVRKVVILVRSTCSYGIQFYFTLAKNENTKNKGDELLVLPSSILFYVWIYDF